MQDTFPIFWKNELVGHLSKLSNDMWYYDGHWVCADTDHARNFEMLARGLDHKHIREFPEDGLLIQMKFEESFSLANMLALGFLGDDLLLRMIGPEFVAYMDLDQFSPWQKVDDSTFFEAELKRELTFFHPLRFKHAQAIGMRKDRDDVLFKVRNGSKQYAVVHLTYQKERSRKFPSTRFYKDWKAFYDQELANMVVSFDMEELTTSIIQEADKHGATVKTHSFDSGAVMIDLYWKDQLYVVQLHDEQLGLSLVTDGADFSTIPERSFTRADMLLENVRRIFQPQAD